MQQTTLQKLDAVNKGTDNDSPSPEEFTHV